METNGYSNGMIVNAGASQLHSRKAVETMVPQPTCDLWVGSSSLHNSAGLWIRKRPDKLRWPPRSMCIVAAVLGHPSSPWDSGTLVCSV